MSTSARERVTPARRPARSADRPATARRSWWARHGEAWRDWAVLAVANHALLVTAAVLHPRMVLLLPLALPLALTLAITTLTVLHDAGHRQFARRDWPNILAVQTAAPFGLWAGHWGLKHRVHHRLSQVYPVDEATRSTSFVRLHAEAPLRPMHRYQHLYTWFFYSLAWIGEIKSQLTYLRRGIVTGLDETPSFRRRLASFLTEKAIAIAILTPYAMALGVGHLAVLLVTAMTVGSVFTALVLVVGHINVGLQAEPGAPVGGRAWAAHLVRTTASFSLDNRVTRWWSGGMTHHLAHHLRPMALRSELPELEVTTVADVVAASGEPEIVFPTFRSAVHHHYLRLRELGRAEHVVGSSRTESTEELPRPASVSLGAPAPVA